MVLQLVRDADQFCGTVGHRFLKRGIFGATLLLADALQGSPATRTLDGDLLRSADTGHNVLSLCVDQVFAVEYVLACSGIAAECDTGSGIVTHIAVNHGLYVDGRSPLLGNLVHAAVNDGTLVHPAVEYSADATPQLLPCRLREVLACVILDCGLETLYKFLQVVYVQLIVELNAFLLLHCVHDGLEGVDVGLALGLHAEHHVAVHLYETAVAVPCETGVAALFGHVGYCGVVHTQVQHRIHHTGHGCAGSGTNRYKQRIVGIVKFFAG